MAVGEVFGRTAVIASRRRRLGAAVAPQLA
jgi:hypothetical protein